MKTKDTDDNPTYGASFLPSSLGRAKDKQERRASLFNGDKMKTMLEVSEQDARLIRGLINSKIKELETVVPGGFMVYENARYMIESLKGLLSRIEA